MSRALPLLLLALLFAACDSDGADGPSEPPSVDLGEFYASVRFDGGDAFDVSGFASATTTPLVLIDSLFFPGDSLVTSDSTTSFMISLVDFDRNQGPDAQTFRSISFARFDSDRPEVGAYALGGFDRDGFTAYFASFDRAGGGSILAAETGTLTIDVSTEERTAGSFTFRGSIAPLEGGESRTATVTGRFDARFRSFGPFVPLP